ncbi:MAG: hypothetical protein IRZ26_04985, partial [Clostridia bacterium]|nr:hypothetical protein [Clostridia bacterium]
MPTRLIWLLIATLLEDVVDWADRIARGEEADRAERRLAQRIAESARAMQEDAMAQAGGGLGRTEELAAGREGWE